VLVVMASVMGFETSSGQAIYLATTAAWAAVLATALVLVSIAFKRRLLGVRTSEQAELR
jgi:hypothetical protein